MPQNKRSKAIKALAMRRNDLDQVNRMSASKFDEETLKLFNSRKHRIEQEIESLTQKVGDVPTTPANTNPIAIVEISA